MFESIESRVLYSASVTNGVLTVGGTSGDDLILLVGDSAIQNKITVYTRHYSGDGNNQVSESEKVGTFAGVKSIVVNGGDGDDFLIANDRVRIPATYNGGKGNDLIQAGYGNDVVNGDAGNDTLFGGRGNDKSNGGDGDDTFIATAETNGDLLDGGAGVDTVKFTNTGFGVKAYLTVSKPGATIDYSGYGGNANFTTYYKNTENIDGSDQDDAIAYMVLDNAFGFTGTVNGNGGNDKITVNIARTNLAGKFAANGGEGNDTIDASKAKSSVSLNGDAGDDIIYARNGAKDNIRGGTGKDSAQRDSAEALVDSIEVTLA